MLGWHTSGRKSDSIGMETVQELCLRLDRNENLCILDVRGDNELVVEGRIPGASHIPLPQLPGRMGEVPDCGHLFIFCGTGRRSTVAASLLKRAGRDEKTTVVLGGFAGWSAASCNIERG